MGTKYGDWLKERREAAGLTQQQLADMAVMTRTHIAHIEAGAPGALRGERETAGQRSEHGERAEQLSAAGGSGGRGLLRNGSAARTTGGHDQGVRPVVRTGHPPDEKVRPCGSEQVLPSCE
ncbi:helix-turn-helix transcriptional regulator [Streptomyces sp. enrichment culture]|uniref:helix-turn-helix transcriptional regulator n=1 Tax=Streptomyces sp. enrichment culture TaxID=1795815 RepID=UPI003F5693DD